MQALVAVAAAVAEEEEAAAEAAINGTEAAAAVAAAVAAAAIGEIADTITQIVTAEMTGVVAAEAIVTTTKITVTNAVVISMGQSETKTAIRVAEV